MTDANTNSTSRIVMHRRPHRKSRYGCKNCKLRRHKCDETRPACTKCLNRNLTCEYMHLPPIGNPFSGHSTGIGTNKMPLPTNTVTNQLASVSADASIPRTPLCLSYPAFLSTKSNKPAKVQALELRLFHHYVNVTTGFAGFLTLWSIRLACQHSSIMDGLLALSAFSLRKQFETYAPTPSRPRMVASMTDQTFEQSIAKASHYYMAKAISAHRKLVSEEGVTEENGDMVLGACLFITYYATGSQRFMSSRTDSRPPTHWFGPIRALKEMVSIAATKIKDEHVKGFIRWDEANADLLPFDETSAKLLPAKQTSGGEGEILPTFDFLLDGLDIADKDYKTYASTVWIMNVLGTNKTIRYILKFPMLLSPRFVELLEASDQRALAMSGYLLMLVKIFNRDERVWWIDGAVEYDFENVMDLMEDSWKSKMAWANEEITSEVGMGFPTGSSDATAIKQGTMFDDYEEWRVSGATSSGKAASL